MEAFLRSYRLEAAEREALQAAPELRPAARAEAERYGRALGRLEALGGEALEAFRSAAAERNVALIPSAASHPVLPLVATAAGRRLQIDAGLRSHSRRFGPAEGFWLPECAYRPGIEPLLAERGLRFFCTDQSAHEPPSESLAPAQAAAGMVAFTLDREAVDLVWSPRGYPSDPVYADFHRLSMEGMRLWSIGGGPYDPAAARARAESHAGEFADAVAQRLREPFESGAESPAWSPSRSIPSCSATGGRRARSGSGRCCASSVSAAFGCSPSRTPWSATSRRSGPCGSRAGARAGTFAPGIRPRSPIWPGPRGAWSCAWWRRSAPRALTPPGGRARGARAARRAGERLGLPGPPQAGRRLPVPALHGPRPRRCSKPYTPASLRTPACETWPPTSASSPCGSPERPGP